MASRQKTPETSRQLTQSYTHAQFIVPYLELTAAVNSSKSRTAGERGEESNPLASNTTSFKTGGT